MSKRFLIPLVLLILLGAAFYDVVFLNKTLKVTTSNAQALTYGVYGQEHNKPRWIPVNGTDAPVSEEPIYEFLKQNFAKGILPLWNPHQATGYALIAMLEVGIFYPLNLILYLLPNIFSWDILILLRLFLAGLFTYALMRQLGFHKTPSLCSAIAFMLSGPLVLLQYWTTNVDILLPLVLLFVDRLVKNPGRRSIGFLSLMVGLTIFGGHPEHIFFVHLYALAFFVFRIFSLKLQKNFGPLFLQFSFCYLLGIGLSAIVFFPFVRHFSHEFWHGHPDGTGLLMEEQPARALTLLLPYFFQKENLTYNFTFAGWWGGYIGTIPFMLAFLSLFKKNSGLNYFFAGAAFLILAKAYSLPVINWIGYLPIFDTCRYAIHTPPLAAFSVAILAGMGVALILEQKQKLFRSGLIFTGILGLIVVLHFIMLQNSNHLALSLWSTIFSFTLVGVLLISLWASEKKSAKKNILRIVLPALIFLELFAYVHRERPVRFDSFAQVPYLEFLKSQPERVRSYGIFWAFYPNTATGFEADDLGYFLGLVPQRYVEFVNNLVIKNHFKNDLRPPALRAIPIEGDKSNILDLLNVRYIIAPSEDRLKTLLTNYGAISKYLTPIYKKEVTIYERANALPRAYAVHRVTFEPDEKRSLELIKKLGTGLREGVVINDAVNRKLLLYVNAQPARDKSQVKITNYSANEVTLETEMEHAGFVVLSDAYHPDWKVMLDGRPWQLFRANYLVRAVFVPEGKHELKFVFAPRSFYLGMWVSLVSLLALAALFLFKRKTP